MIVEKLAQKTEKFCVVILGTEKNAGKTTVLSRLAEQSDERLALTSIGRDGESVDVVYGTEKPKIAVKKGTLVATAAGLLKECSLSKRILFMTGINTPLGEVVIFSAEDEGYVQLSGPSIVSQLVEIKRLFKQMGAQKMYVDGALGRKTFSACALADEAVLVSGASTYPDCETAAEETAFIAETFFYPRYEGGDFPSSGIAAIKNGERICLDDLSQIGTEEFYDEILLSGALTDGIIKRLSAVKFSSLVVADQGKITASRQNTQNFLRAGKKIYLLNAPDLVAICTNPFSVKGFSYDAQRYVDEVAKRVSVPVFDIVGEIYSPPKGDRK